MPTTPAPLNTAGRFAHIDAMRAFAVMIVVVAHAGLGHIIPGGSGVTIFFSISGFIITYKLLRERDKTGGFSIREFYVRRAVKIGPPLIVAVAIPTLIYSLFGNIHWPAFLGQIFFFFNWFKINGAHDVLPGSNVLWSLSIEEQFYIAFALVWLLAVGSKYWRAIIAAVSVACVLWSTAMRLLLTDSAAPDRIYYGSDTRVDGIAFGVLAAVAYHWWQARGSRASGTAKVLGSDWALVAAVLVYVASLVIRDEWFRETFRFTLQSVAACSIIVYGLLPGGGQVRRVFYAVSGWRLIQVLGLASYSIYLVHLTITDTFHAFVRLPMPVDVTVVSILATLTGIALYRLVEVPVHAAFTRARSNPRALVNR